MKRGSVVALLATLLLVTMVAPASATKAPADGATVDGHKITICHATRSLSNPYVEITIDIAAWNDPGDDKNHGDHHTRTKDGVTWFDYVLDEGEECSIPTLTCDPLEDIYVEFSGEQLVSSELPHKVRLTEEALTYIPAGTYDLILISTDDGLRRKSQKNEQWRALFGDGSASSYSPDLPDGYPPPTVSSLGGRVTFSQPVTSVTAEHWDVENDSLSPDSVVPVAVCLIGEVRVDL